MDTTALRNDLAARIADLRADLESASRILTSTPFVVRLAGGLGLYAKAIIETREDGTRVVAKVQPCGLEHATRFGREDAEGVAANTFNGHGAASAVVYVQALRDEIADKESLLDRIDTLVGA